MHQNENNILSNRRRQMPEDIFTLKDTLFGEGPNYYKSKDAVMNEAARRVDELSKLQNTSILSKLEWDEESYEMFGVIKGSVKYETPEIENVQTLVFNIKRLSKE